MLGEVWKPHLLCPELIPPQENITENDVLYQAKDASGTGSTKDYAMRRKSPMEFEFGDRFMLQGLTLERSRTVGKSGEKLTLGTGPFKYIAKDERLPTCMESPQSLSRFGGMSPLKSWNREIKPIEAEPATTVKVRWNSRRALRSPGNVKIRSKQK
ncbi:hypothetical protein Tco_0666430 [Tanacetum coccineum]